MTEEINISKALEEALKEYGLEWNDIETVILDHDGEMQMFRADQAKEGLNKVVLSKDKRTYCQAFTEERMFGLVYDKEKERYYISSLPMVSVFDDELVDDEPVDIYDPDILN